MLHLVSTTGATVAHDMATYSPGNYLDAVDIEPGTYTSGWLAFLTTRDFIPGKLVWREIFGEKVIVTIVEPPDYRRINSCKSSYVLRLYIAGDQTKFTERR
jgi:hypothetical protein